jgi:hypothetical protein
MKTDEWIELRLPTWSEVRGWIRGVLGIRGEGAAALGESQERRYDDVSRCC